MSKERQATTILMGSLNELLKNRDYAYVSKSTPKYSHLEEAGRIFVADLVEQILPTLVEAENARIRNEAEELMMNKLSGDSL